MDCEDDSNLPKEIKRNKIDKNNNWIPDYLDELTESDPEKIQEYSEEKLEEMYEDEKLEEDQSLIDTLEWKLDEIENILDWLNCWFGWSNCFWLPVNWAPLAPWNDPVAFWMLLWDWLNIDEWIPVLSWLTWKDMHMSWWCLQVPTVWPISPDKYTWVCGQEPWAWGILWIDSPTNFFRIFVTPTLTWTFWVAACFGWPAEKVWNIPPKWLSPVIPWWNCVVYAKKLKNLCEDEELKQKPESLGPVCNASCSDGNWYWVINWNCEFNPNKKLPVTNKIDTKLAEEFLNHRAGRGWWNLSWDYKNFLKSITKNDVVSKKDLISWSSNIDVDLDINIWWKTFNDVEEITNTRIDAFPDFITSWVDRQIEEFITKLADFPTLYIIPPKFDNIIKWDWKSYWEKLAWDKKALAKTSWIKEVYDFIWHIPFINLELEPVEVNIPEWIDMNTSIKQWKIQLETYDAQIQKLISDSKWAIKPWNLLKIKKFQESVRKNMAVIESYTKIPEQIADLAWKKEQRLSQIMCYIDTIQEMTWWRIYRNWLRFKAWVETYLLVKAALKSWQLLADIFIDYDYECHECKNERHDSLGFQFRLVSMIIPKIPVIKFPKWPDIVLDMHDIRLWINLKLPEFKIKKRQLVLPPLPTLKLPTVSECISYDIEIPEVPTLPMIDLWELPDLPAIPKLELPDLPPPPKLPKILWALEWILSIMKLITRAMCILKKIPLTPETRAWDQIAFLTEWSWYRSFDFSFWWFELPNFSFPWVDEIRVQTYVNLEQDVDFITEIAKSIVEPVNELQNNLFDIFNWLNTSIDFSWVCEDEVDNTTNSDWYSKNVKWWEEYPDTTNYNDSSFVPTPLNLAKTFSKGIQKTQKCIKKNSKDTIWAKEFLAFINKQLSSDFIVKNREFDKLRHSYDLVNNYTFSKENKIIKNLQKENIEKFETLRNIIKKELKDTKNFKNQVKNLKNKKFKKISNNKIDKQELYNKAFEKYNESFKKSANNLLNPSYFDLDSLKKDWEMLKERIRNWINDFNKKYLSYNNLLALNSQTQINNDKNWCYSPNASYKRKYKWIYIIEKKWSKKISYRLFDYLDDLDWKETTKAIDYDLDWDKDLLYLMDWDLYLKKNLRKNSSDNHLNWVEVLDTDDNVFVNWDTFYEAVNNVYESFSANNYINISFSASKNEELKNYRLTFYQIIDKYLNVGNSSYIPKNIKQYLVDSIAWEWQVNKLDEKENYKIFKNIAYISEIWSNIWKVLLKTKELKNIKNSLKNWNIAVVQAKKKIYTWNSDAVITYLDDNDEEHTVRIKAHTNIEFASWIRVIKISWDAYVTGDRDIKLVWNDIHKYLWLPISFDTTIKLIDNNFNANVSSHITIRYYDDSEAMLDFRKIKYYNLYDLGWIYTNYNISLNIENDYYYARLQNFRENIFWTKSAQVLLSPQLASDHFPPELDLLKKIKIPVYQKEEIDLTDSIYEDSWIENIKDIKIKWLPEDKFDIHKTKTKISILFGKFDNIFKKKIKFILTDANWNIWEKQVDFEVYSPVPEVDSINSSWKISWTISENLTDEPINIYRIRWNLIKKLASSSWTTRTYTNLWRYEFYADYNKSDYLSVTSSWVEIFRVNEYTWKIKNNDFKYITKAFIWDDNYINIWVYKDNKLVFVEKIDLSKTNRDIILVDEFKDLDKNTLYFKFENNSYDYYKLPKTIKENPWALVIYRKTDIKKKPLFVILPDSRIRILNSYYDISYSSLWDYILIKLIDKHYNRVIWKLLFKIKNAFIIK